MLQNASVTAFTVSKLLRENLQFSYIFFSDRLKEINT